MALQTVYARVSSFVYILPSGKDNDETKKIFMVFGLQRKIEDEGILASTLVS